MTRLGIVAIWPFGLLVVVGVAALSDRRWARSDPVRARPASDGPPASGRQIAVLVGVPIVGAAAVFAVMCLLGVLVVHTAPATDRAVFRFLSHHHSHHWVSAMNRATKIGDTWTTWGAAAAGAVCLAVGWRKRWLMPPVLLGVAVIVDKLTTLSLRHVFHRIGPPTSPLGTYPSGGCDRVILFYGLIAYLLWRQVGGTRKAAVWGSAGVAALGFSEAYSRVYLGLHWFSDTLSGLFYGVLLLAVFVAATEMALRLSEQRLAPAHHLDASPNAVGSAPSETPAEASSRRAMAETADG